MRFVEFETGLIYFRTFRSELVLFVLVKKEGRERKNTQKKNQRKYDNKKSVPETQNMKYH